MKITKTIMFSLLLVGTLFSGIVSAYVESKDVTISNMWTHWNNGTTVIQLSDGKYCYIQAVENNLLSTLLNIKNTTAEGTYYCDESQTFKFWVSGPTNVYPLRLHRVGH